jgi:hypothetical protein
VNDTTESTGTPGWWAPAHELAEELATNAAGSVRCVLLYGSHLLGVNPDRHSALDFVVIVDDYRSFYAALKAAGELHRPVPLMSALSGILPPNVIAYAPRGGRAAIAKCLVVTSGDLEAALGPEPKDHFLLGRLVQKVGFAWWVDEGAREAVAAQLDGARRAVLDWMAPYLHEPVDAEGLGLRLMEVCYQGELRPEARNRAVRVFEAQAVHFREIFTPVLERAAREGRLVAEGGRYRLAEPASPSELRQWRRHFRRSKLRATARWLKHTVTFDNWLPYVVRKVERHTGSRIELTRLERRLPLLFLWPRAIRVLLTRPRREIDR